MSFCSQNFHSKEIFEVFEKGEEGYRKGFGTYLSNLVIQDYSDNKASRVASFKISRK
jgi:hypothetical protein